VIETLAVAGYRSLRDLVVRLARLTVITGGNGSGKSNLYRALRLLVDAADGNLGRAIAREGGMPSALWAGGLAKGKRAEPKRLSVGFGDGQLAYELRLGLPNRKGPTEPVPDLRRGESAFFLDPEVKEETIRTLGKPRVNLLERRNVSTMVRDEEGRPQTFGAQLAISESVLSQLAEPHRYPALSVMRERLRRWRFYHQVRTDADSPLRAEQVGTFTPVLAHDGSDIAPALQTIIENGDPDALATAVADGLDGARVEIEVHDARFRLKVALPGIRRLLDAAELSDGMLRYLALLAALMSPRPPELLVLNEPETSLHPQLLAPLAQQIIAAARRSQVIVVSHAAGLVEPIAAAKDAVRIELVKELGATTVADRGLLDLPSWKWTD